MSTLQKFCFMFCLVIWANLEGVLSWTYGDTENWGNEYPLCNGNLQSPIELIQRESLVFPLANLEFGNYEQPLRGHVNLTNNGYTVEFMVPKTTNGRRPYIIGGTLRGKYEAVKVQFHWGSANSNGSEHVIDGVRYDVEMHIVHKNTRYGNIMEASMNSTGLAVLGVMLKIDNDNNVINSGLNKVFNQVPNVINYSSSATIESPLSLGQLLEGLNTTSFYTYRGSLTTPNCAEAVTWSVFPQALPVAREQIEKLWSVQNENGNVLINNFRPLQNRNKRPVLYSPIILS